MIIEFRKIFKNRVTYICLSSLILIVVIGVWFEINEYYINYDLSQKLFAHFPDSKALISPWEYWFGQSTGFFSSFYYFIFPLLVALPIVDTIFKEKVSGNLNYQLTRTSILSFFINRFIFTFIISFMLFVIPLIFGIILSNLITGTWNYSSFSIAYDKMVHGKAILADSTSLSYKKEIFSQVLCTSPYLYMIIYFLIGGLYAGIYSCFGLATSLFIKNRYLIMFMPMCLYLGCWVLFSLLGLLSWDPFNFLDPRQPVRGLNYLPIIVDFGLLLIVTTFLYSIGARKIIDIQ
jgi:hypothetical protein